MRSMNFLFVFEKNALGRPVININKMRNVAVEMDALIFSKGVSYCSSSLFTPVFKGIAI